VLFLQPEFEISYVICRDGVNAKMEAPLVHDLMAETLVTEYLVEIVKMMFPALNASGVSSAYFCIWYDNRYSSALLPPLALMLG
jgi:hypothetical protein